MEAMDSERTIFEGFEGVHLVADVRGDPDAWPVLFLHGGGQTRFAWGRTAEIVAQEGWRTIALDQRGHGESDWAPNGDYSLTSYCADTVAVCDELGKPPVLVGASLGGMAAMLAEGTSDRTVSSGLEFGVMSTSTRPQETVRSLVPSASMAAMPPSDAPTRTGGLPNSSHTATVSAQKEVNE